MKSSFIAIAAAASLAAMPALGQQGAPAGPDHDTHHAQAAPTQAPTQAPPQSGSTPAPAQPVPPRPMVGGQGMMGQGMTGQNSQAQAGMMSGMGQGMMNCPMMQAGMMGMMGAMAMAQPRGDQSVGSLALDAVNRRMHREMMAEFTGNVDADFARAMIAHHRGAVDMAKVVAAFGTDPQIRRLAESIVKAQEGEIATMTQWLAENAKR